MNILSNNCEKYGSTIVLFYSIVRIMYYSRDKVIVD